MTLIGNIDPSWKDMSKYVVHFAKETVGRSAYDNAISILYQRRIIVRDWVRLLVRWARPVPTKSSHSKTRA